MSSANTLNTASPMHEIGRVGVGEAKQEGGNLSEVSFDTHDSNSNALELTEKKMSERKLNSLEGYQQWGYSLRTLPSGSEDGSEFPREGW